MSILLKIASKILIETAKTIIKEGIHSLPTRVYVNSGYESIKVLAKKFKLIGLDVDDEIYLAKFGTITHDQLENQLDPHEIAARFVIERYSNAYILFYYTLEEKNILLEHKRIQRYLRDGMRIMSIHSIGGHK